MSAARHLVIIGGGLTAHSAATSARHNGYRGKITIVSDDPDLPYDRTPLSKAVLLGKREASDLGFQPDGDYAGDQISVICEARAESVDIDVGQLVLSSRDTLDWDDLLIATGARPIQLSNPGFDLPGVHYLRTIADAGRIQADLAHANHVVVIGAGFIGSEVAASARSLGKEVTLVDMLDAPMSGAFPPEISSVCAGIHSDHGTKLQMNTRVDKLQGDGRVEQAVFGDGTTVDCDLVIVGVGVRPNVELFNDTGLEIEDGIVTDEYCRTSIPNVYAAGDVARWYHPELKQHLRIEHFDNAGSQGTFAGKVIAGTAEEPFAPIPYFWSDQYETNMQFAGFAPDNCDVVIRGNPDERAITAFYLENGAICAAVTINQAREFRSCRRLVAARAEIDPETLRDPETDIRKISREYR